MLLRRTYGIPGLNVSVPICLRLRELGLLTLEQVRAAAKAGKLTDLHRSDREAVARAVGIEPQKEKP